MTTWNVHEATIVNVAEGKPALSDSQNSPDTDRCGEEAGGMCPPSHAFDGNKFMHTSGNMFAPASDSGQHFIVVDLGEYYWLR